jgi:hypothetical protein
VGHCHHGMPCPRVVYGDGLQIRKLDGCQYAEYAVQAANNRWSRCGNVVGKEKRSLC